MFVQLVVFLVVVKGHGFECFNAQKTLNKLEGEGVCGCQSGEELGFQVGEGAAEP